MHGVQLWVALPDGARHDAARDFTQYDHLPTLERDGLQATVMVGEFEGLVSSATTYTPLVGVDLRVDGTAVVALRTDFEYGVLGIDGDLLVEDQPVGRSEIVYLGGDRSELRLTSAGPARALLLGGEPFAEELVMWWNFIGRSHDEIVEARREWNDGGGERFGQVRGFDGDRLLAPPMPGTRLKSRGRHRRQ